jgi:phage terminase large subunit-like protein
MNKREIQSLTDEGVAKVLASDVDTADGVIPTLAIVDELHRAQELGPLRRVPRWPGARGTGR